MIYAQIPQKHLLATDVSDAIATCWFMAISMMNEAEQIVECLENDEGLSSGEAWKMGKLVNFFKNMETSWRNTADDLYILVEHYELRVDTQGSMISDDVRDRRHLRLGPKGSPLREGVPGLHHQPSGRQVRQGWAL